MSSKTMIVLFTRYPLPGFSKTRLIPALGEAGAARLQQRMTEFAVWQLRGYAADHDADLRIAFTGCGAQTMADWLGHDLAYMEQQGQHIGLRMADVMKAVFDAGYRRCIVVGADCPAVSSDLLEQADRALSAGGCVIGPVEDGGYWLIGMTRQVFEKKGGAGLFERIFWSTEEVLAQTVAKARDHQLPVAFLPVAVDVDRPADMAAWQAAAQDAPLFASGARISVIIPALNEAGGIEQAIRSAQQGDGVEVIVADGGSTDATPAVARSCGASVLYAPRCKALQMNAGACAATGDILLFLHADTRLPMGYDTHVRRAMESTEIAAGAFMLRIEARGRAFRRIEKLVAFRSRVFSLPYGDQAIFVRRPVFESLGRYLEMPIMEDFEFMRRLKRNRHPLCLLPVPVHTDARRWERLGLLRTTLRNQRILLGYLLGVPPEKLRQWY